MIIDTKLGEAFLGTAIFGPYVLYQTPIWNSWDDLALYKSLSRRPEETNQVFRTRILAAKDYNSTKQGLVNYICDSLDLTKNAVTEKRVFSSLNTPLSYTQYLKVVTDDTAYVPPQAIVDGVTFTFPSDEIDIYTTSVEFDGCDELSNPLKFTYNYEKTVIYDTTKLKTWTIWKNIDQAYFPYWEANYTPDTSIVLKYQTVIDGELRIIEESSEEITPE